MIRHQLRFHGKWLIAIAFFALVAAAAATWILTNQRLRTPFADRYTVRVEFANTQSLTAGLGQPVNVAGVRVGDIVSTELHDGRSVAKLSIETDRLPAVYRDAQAALRQNTPLEDMQIELYPGKRSSGELDEDDMVSVENTKVPVNSEELTAVLDGDTRAYLDGLISAVARGTKGRGRDLRATLEALGPTTAQTRQVNAMLAARRGQISRLVHNLSLLTRSVGERDSELRDVVSGAGDTLQALGREDRALRESLALLPGTLGSARRSLQRAERFAGDLPPALNALADGSRDLPSTLRAGRGLLDAATPMLQELSPFLREGQPVSRDLATAAQGLEQLSPPLRKAFSVLDEVANAVAYNPPGSEEGYLFWTAWFFHNTASVFSSSDVHGPVTRGLFVAPNSGGGP